jgi:hypothetical protein
MTDLICALANFILLQVGVSADRYRESDDEPARWYGYEDCEPRTLACFCKVITDFECSTWASTRMQPLPLLFATLTNSCP